MNPAPIGAFDSGVGGLSVLRAIRAQLPHEDLLYVGDSAHLPYGGKPAGFIEARAITITEFLLAQGAKAIVVACNTATSAAIATLRTRFSVPIVGLEPALKPAAQHSRSGLVGVLATSGTLGGEKFADLLHRFGGNVEVLVQSCPGLVECVEAGDLTSDATRTLLERYVTPLLARGADTLVLGCTHYPFLAPLLRTIAGDGIVIVDPSPAVARELARRLGESGLNTPGGRPGSARFWTSGDPDSLNRAIARLCGAQVEVRPLPVERSTAFEP